MLVAEPPNAESDLAFAPAVALPLAAPLIAAGGATLTIPADFAPVALQGLPAAASVKPNAALVVSIALHVGLVAGIIGLATSDLSSGDGDIDTIELVVEQAPEPAGAEPMQSVAHDAAAAQMQPTPAEPATSQAPPAEPKQAQQAAAPPPLLLAELPPPAPLPDVLRQAEEERRLTEARAEAEERRAREKLAQEQVAQEQLAQEQRRQAAARAAERQRRVEAAQKAAELERREELREKAAARAQAREAARAEERRAAQRRVQQASLGRGETHGGAERPSALPSPPAAQRARAGDSGGFDPASYRALVARAVRAAVGSRCSQAAGARVVVALTIGGSGAISSASVSSSSGNAAFDAASAAAVRRAGPFPPPAGRSGVSVPVAVSCR